MFRRSLLTCMIMLLIHEVSSLEVIVNATEGGPAILPCSYKGLTINQVFWRDNEEGSVHNFGNTNVSAGVQDKEYRGRTESFPDEYTKGNFSIKLSDVRLADQRLYTCHTTGLTQEQSVKLQVKAREQPTTPKPRNKAMEPRSVLTPLVFTVLLGYNLL